MEKYENGKGYHGIGIGDAIGGEEAYVTLHKVPFGMNLDMGQYIFYKNKRVERPDQYLLE